MKQNNRYASVLFRNLDVSKRGRLNCAEFCLLPLADPRIADAFMIGAELRPSDLETLGGGKAKCQIL
jgi:hypothetical protein